MSIPREASQLHDQYEAAPADVRKLVDDCWYAVRDVLKANGRKINGSDPAEVLVSYLFQYINECPEADDEPAQPICADCGTTHDPAEQCWAKR